MDSRMNKYSDDNRMSRVSKNASLYKEINESELDNFSVKSNATVIGNQEPEIDIEKIKKILDKKYNEPPKRRSIRVEPREEESRLVDDKNETRSNNEVVDSSEKPEMNKAQEDLMELINTITINEAKVKEGHKDSNDDEIDPLSILEDLKGDEGTAVYEKMAEEVKIEATSNIELTDDSEKEEKVDDDNSIDSSFYTTTSFKKKDFDDDDNDDFLDDNKMNIGVKILIVVVIIAFAVGLFLFLRSFLNS